MIRPGLVSVTFRQLLPVEVADLAAACELEAIEWGGDVHAPTEAAAREIRKITEDRGLVSAAFGSYWRAEGEFGATLETAIALNAPTIRVWAGSTGSAETAHRRKVIDALYQACAMAASAGVTISLEFHAGTLTDTLDSTLSLVGEVGHPALRLYWQPVPQRSHSVRLHELQAMLPLLSNLHVFQWTKPREETLRHALAEGEAEWREYLAEAAGDRFALLEFVPNDDPAILSSEAATLRRWLV
jgi:sugar phosphate isomerase/epimerase